MALVFWALLAMAAFVIGGYGFLLIVLERFAGARRRPQVAKLHVTVLIAAHNEQSCIAEKLQNVLDQDSGCHRLGVVIVSDGSMDRTAEIVRSFNDPRIRLVEIKEHVGKATALNRALEQINGDVVVFSDANSHLAEGALNSLLGWFADPEVGGVCGALHVSKGKSGWLGLAERVYWTYDNRLKAAESRLGGAVSAQGSLYAIRRELVGDIPGSVSDDFFISTQVVVAGQRLVFEPAAVTTEPVSNDTRKEFFRRVRSTERGWRGLLMRRSLLNPLSTGFYAFQLLCHKVLRRMTPLVLFALLILSALLSHEHWFYQIALMAQLAFYGLALLALLWPAARLIPVASIAFFFTETQIAMAWGLVRVALGKHSRRWKPAREATSNTG